MAKVQKNGGYFIVTDYARYVNPLRLRKKRALLSYLTFPVIEELEGKNIVRFSNSGIVLSWARVLNELGYIVDIVDWEDKNFKPINKYDLVVFHGGKNFDSLLPRLKGHPRFIHFLTGSYWKFNNEAEDARISAFARRHKVKPKRDRYIYADEDPVNKASKGIIVLGDSSMRNTYPRSYPKVLTINNASYPDDHFKKTRKNYDKARNNFLFYAGSGNIHKGLDLLIDAFKDLDQHLYIVTVPDKKIMEVYKKELALDNIHLVGQVEMRQKAFYEAMDQCAYVILPSCSEGQAGSVVEAMNQGLIPIVSKETRLDARPYGVVLPSNSIACIKEIILKMSALPSDEVRRLATLAHKAVLREHTPKYFRKSLKQAIKTVLG